MNQQVLKDLPLNSSANFYQAKDLLIIAATGQDGRELAGQHGLEWIQDQAEFAAGQNHCHRKGWGVRPRQSPGRR